MAPPTPSTSSTEKPSPTAADLIAPYACDNCRSRKVGCSRERSGCKRCTDENKTCIYSRFGVIRRNRKRKHDAINDHEDPLTPDSAPPEVDASSLRSNLATDIDSTHERLSGIDSSSYNSIGALSSLSEACAAVWHDAADFDRSNKSFFLFEDHTDKWVDAFELALERGRLFFPSAPPHVLQLLRACRPQQVKERAWLVMYYGVILSMVSSTTPDDKSTKAKLRCNLWLALNDVRLLLEPSDANVHALLLLACHVEEFTTPSLCWMLVNNACRMLQALGINHRRLDPQTLKRRRLVFWHLYLVDIALALIFGRAPNFHPAMAKEIPLPSLDQLLPFQPHVAPNSTPGTFGPHYIHQKIQLTRIMGDIWKCSYEGDPPAESNIEAITAELDAWYDGALKILEAAAMTEKPFLDSKGAASIDLSLHMCHYQHDYLFLLLARSSKQLRSRRIKSSKQMLYRLKDVVSDSEETFNGIVWMLLCGSFTPFLILFGEILSNSKDDLHGSRDQESEDAFAAMKQLPVFLQEMSLRNSLAAKLERIAVVFVQHARSVIDAQAARVGNLLPDFSNTTDFVSGTWPSTEDIFSWDSVCNHTFAGPAWDSSQSGMQNNHPGPFGDFSIDFNLDWAGLDGHT